MTITLSDTLLERRESPDQGVDARPATLPYLLLDAFGREQHRRGVVWCEGPLLREGRVLWLIHGSCWRPVLQTRRRHRSRGGMGRWMDPGESYSDITLQRRAGGGTWEREGWGGARAATRLQRADGVERSAAEPPWRCWARPGDTRLQVDPLPRHVFTVLSTPYE